MEKLPKPYDDLTFTRHAELRMQQRNITVAHIHRALLSTKTLVRGRNALHYDTTSWIGVVVCWRTRTIITVMNVWPELLKPSHNPTTS